MFNTKQIQSDEERNKENTDNEEEEEKRETDEKRTRIKQVVKLKVS